MNKTDFYFWLKGYFESNKNKDSETQIKEIKEQLDIIIEEDVTEPRFYNKDSNNLRPDGHVYLHMGYKFFGSG